MARDTSWATLRRAWRDLEQDWSSLRLTVAEDRPKDVDAAAIDHLGDAVEEGQGLLAGAAGDVETLARADDEDGDGLAELRRALQRVGDAHLELCKVLERRVGGTGVRSGLRRLARRRGGEASAWCRAVRQQIVRCRHRSLALQAAIHETWSELCTRLLHRGGGARAVATGQIFGARLEEATHLPP